MSFLRFFGRSFLLWYRQEAGHQAAALAYFTPFAITPLIIFTITIVGFIVGTEQVVAMLLRWGNAIDPGITNLLYHSVQQYNSLQPRYFLPVVSLVFLTVMIFVTFNSLTMSLHKMWGINRHGWRASLSRLSRIALFVALLQVYLVSIIIFGEFLNYIEVAGNFAWPSFVGAAATFCSAIFVIALGYGVLAHQAPRFTARFVGATVTCVLFLFSRELVALNFSTMPSQDLFGAAGLLISLLVWVYVWAAIILYGAACAYVYDQVPHQT